MIFHTEKLTLNDYINFYSNVIKLSEYVIPDGVKRNSGISKSIALTISFILS